VVSDKKIFKISANENTLWTLAAMLDFKSGRGPSNEHFWQVWFNSVQWFQRRRFKCEKLTDERRSAVEIVISKIMKNSIKHKDLQHQFRNIVIDEKQPRVQFLCKIKIEFVHTLKI
jgi:hypothetical protein